jgi:dTDP-4-amino-4,6-dideoxygalactose transaminase
MKIIPFLNLNDTNKKFFNIFKKKFSNFILKENYILGNEVVKFEENFAKYCGTKYAIGVGNGFDALYLILNAPNIKENDKVIVPAHTFIATWLSISKCGAKIVPLELNEKNYNIDPNLISSKINKKNKGNSLCSLIWLFV